MALNILSTGSLRLSLRRLIVPLRPRRLDEPSNRLKIDGLELRDISPVESVSGGHAFNRAGRLVLRANSQAGPVKLWEAANDRHAAFLCRVCRHPALGEHLPRVLAVAGSFVVSEWVKGQPLGAAKTKNVDHWIEGMATLLAAFHRTDVNSLGEAGFDYWAHLVQPRFLRSAMLAGYLTAAQGVCETLNGYLASAPRHLSHPDLTRSNIVRSPTGNLISIDNELVTVSGAPFMDLLNATRKLSLDSARAYYTAYRRQTPHVEWPPREVEQGFWLAREAGAWFAGRAIARLARLFENYVNDRHILPLDRVRDRT